MKTYFDKDTQKWVSYKPESYWSGMVDIYGKRIYLGDIYQVLNARGCNNPVTLRCDEYTCFLASTWLYTKYFKYIKMQR